MIGRINEVVIDCPDPKALAAFYCDLLGLQVINVDSDDDWVSIAENDHSPGLAFQQVADYQPPQWPGQEHPQQFHIDVMVDDMDVAHQQVLALGAIHVANDGTGFRVFTDPAGHPFCLVRRPDWASPIHG